MSKSVVDIQAQLRAELEKVSNTVAAPTGYNISTKGKSFTLPTGEQSDGPLHCIILDWISENTYYSGVYNPKKLEAPDCFAINRVVSDLAPSKNASKPQADACEGCPRNEWDSSPTSGGKACKNTRKLLVVPEGSDENAQPFVLTVSPTGLKHFDKYVKALEKYEKHPVQVVTEISFDPNSAFPSLRFKVGAEHEDLGLMWKLREDNQSILEHEREAVAPASA